MVVRVVVNERTEGAGDEKVLSPPFLESSPPLAVRLVPATDEAMCEGALIDNEASCSVETVGAVDRGGAMPCMEDWSDSWLRETTDVTPVLFVVSEGWL